MNRSATVSELESHLGYWLRFVSNHVSHAFQKAVESQGVTVAEWVVLRALYRLPEPCHASQVAQQLGMTRGAISKLVDRLCRKQLLTRSATSGEDQRVFALRLTAAARELVPRLARLADDNDARCFGHLTAEQQQQLRAVLQDMVARNAWKAAPVS